MMANLHFSSKLVGRSGVRMRSGVNSRVKSMAAGSKKLMLGAVLLVGMVFSANGQGAHCGAAAADWARLRAAVGARPNGDTIKIHTRSSGTMEGAGSTGVYNLVLCDQENFINSDGTAITIPSSKRITIKSANTTDIITLHTPTTDRHFVYGNTSSNLTIEDMTLDGDNIAGGIYAFGQLTVNNSTIKNCVSNDDGGGIRANGLLTVNNSTIKNCISNGDGGGIFANNTLTLKGKVIVSNNTATSSTSCGGGIFSFGDINTGAALTKLEITDNTCIFRGGGIYIRVSVSLSPEITISRNTAAGTGGTSGQGGGIYAHTDLTISGGLISGNTANYRGGGIFHANNILTISGGTIQGNYAEEGGGIYEGDQILTRLNISEANPLIPTIIGGDEPFPSDATKGVDANVGNKATSYGGGMYYVNGCTIGTNVKIKNNEAGVGGGIGTIGETNITGAIISNNKATSSGFAGGGGIYASNDDITLIATTITNNTAVNHGGGIYFTGSSSTLNIGNSTITNNTAVNHGGGIYMATVTKLSASAGVTFSGNKAAQAYWLSTADGTYCGASSTQAITHATTTQPALKNPPTTFSAPPAGNYPFEYAYNNYDVNWVGKRNNNQIIDTVCFSDSVTLSVKVVNGGQNPTYKWILNRDTISGNNDSIFKYKSSGRDTIQCKVYPDTACGNEVYSQTMVIYRLPKPVLNQPSSTEVCVGKETESVIFSGTYQYVKWEVTTGNGTAIGMPANSGTGNIPAFTTTNSGEITITATPVSGECEGDPKTFTITVTPKVKPKATIRVK